MAVFSKGPEPHCTQRDAIDNEFSDWIVISDPRKNPDRVLLVSPKFQGCLGGILIAINSLRQFGLPVSGYILINRSASACKASVSVTW